MDLLTALVRSVPSSSSESSHFTGGSTIELLFDGLAQVLDEMKSIGALAGMRLALVSAPEHRGRIDLSRKPAGRGSSRSAVPIWDTQKRFPVFHDSIVLFRAGDRVKFVPIGKEEFEFVEAKVKEGTYIYNVVDYQKFSVRNYKAWTQLLDTTKRF
jgi:hypothetical protein